ncbi:hypothetical protein [Streptomyces sp. DH41]|uniref:hypothetical protein n=1 Tax=Streptomyces sp. DH41 TaxID=3040125 RepID=UPI00244158D4|nr:hypothetical protein [Streptomyces sp. DH41]MDG9728678.1 hypothetical protein [Streptomyces sp. DH41]
MGADAPVNDVVLCDKPREPAAHARVRAGATTSADPFWDCRTGLLLQCRHLPADG